MNEEAKQTTEIAEDSNGSWADVSWDRSGGLSIWIRNPKVEGRRTYCHGFDIEDLDDIEDFGRALRTSDSFDLRDGEGVHLSFDGERLSIHPGLITRSVRIDLDRDARMRFADFVQEV
jgi:hypothetical protein